MIYEALELLRAELKAYLVSLSITETVELGSIANAPLTSNKLILTLVNLEEESALKNQSPYQRNATGGFDVVKPPVFLNLYVLVSATHGDNSYDTALKLLARAVQCFQHKTRFTVANTPTATNVAAVPQAVTLRLLLNMYPLSFEKLNQLWGTLGGKQFPSVVYKVSVVEEQAEAQMGSGASITTIVGKSEVIQPMQN